MDERDQILVGRYFTRTLSKKEERAFAQSALLDQELFDEFFEENSWQDLLSSIIAGRELLSSLSADDESQALPAGTDLRQRLRESLDLLTCATRLDYSSVERSNMFDEWKIRLLEIAEDSAFHNSNFRQIAGALIIATRKKDLIDLTSSNMENLCRSMKLCEPSASHLDRSEVFEILRRDKLLTTFPAMEENAEQLDSILDEILKQDSARGMQGTVYEKNSSR